MRIIRTVACALGSLLLAGGALADSHRFQSSDVIDVTGMDSFYQGGAWLVRSEDEIEGRIVSKVTTAGDPYTIWAVIFNNPEECAAVPCADTDIANEAVNASVHFATSSISAADGGLETNGKPAGGGVINMDFEFEAGSLPDGLFVLVGNPDGLAEGNGYGAEIHLVVDNHPPIPDGMSWLPDLTTTNFPGAGPATNERAAIFLACNSAPCPGSVFSP